METRAGTLEGVHRCIRTNKDTSSAIKGTYLWLHRMDEYLVDIVGVLR